jgi:predicted xylose isomerase-like sugar epimerase
VNHFTPASLRAMVEASGLKVVSFNALDRFFLSDNMWMVARKD